MPGVQPLLPPYLPVHGLHVLIIRTGQECKDTYKDPEMAMAEVRNILLAVSEKMTDGHRPLGSINSMNIAPEALSGFK